MIGINEIEKKMILKMILKMNLKVFLGVLLLSILQPVDAKVYSNELKTIEIKTVVNKAILWQKKNMPTKGREIWNPQFTGWADGVFFSALADWAEYDNSLKIKEWYESVAEKNRWQVSSHTLNPANDIAVSLMYGKIWMNNPQEKLLIKSVDDWEIETVKKLFGGWTPLIPTIERLDYQMKYYPKTNNLSFQNPENHQRWSWCDALYMAAPTYALFANITGNNSYREFMNREFWITTETLYDTKEHLFFRDTRFLTMKEANGAKVFWGRGNGWVVAAIARIINFLPADYPDRGKYEQLFKELMSRLITLQDSKGYWHTSLLDTVNYVSPETSATGFISYALWWGINNGFLSEKDYLPYAQKSWSGMVAAVHRNGKLGYVQPIGDAPENITKDKNEVYGTAALIMAGLEAAKYVEKMN
jgi:rhamnogalacturonyl hydrolase YesR